MEIEKALNGTELTLKIIGRLDTVTAPVTRAKSYPWLRLPLL